MNVRENIYIPTFALKVQSVKDYLREVINNPCILTKVHKEDIL